MSFHIPAQLIAVVRQRAADICEYCHLPATSQEATFHADHVRPRSRGGRTSADNLALACVTCSLKKAARTHVVDPITKKKVPLFNPRRHIWASHFRWTLTMRLVGKTSIGRAAVFALAMNRPQVVRIRQALRVLGML
jgi:hypothetical protein